MNQGDKDELDESRQQRKLQQKGGNNNNNLGKKRN
jgi:hypothetical protein